MEVEFVELPDIQDRISIEVTQQSVPKELLQTPDEIPRFQEDDALAKVLGADNFDPNFRTKSRETATDLNPDKLSLNGSRLRRTSQGIKDGTDTPLKSRDVLSNESERLPYPRKSDGGDERVSVSPPRGSSDDKISQPTSLSPRTGEDVGLPFDIKGEVSGRNLRYRPNIPESPGNEVGVIVLTFWVTPQGDVHRVQRKRTAGDPDLERIAKDWVRRLKFDTLGKHREQKDQWGEITIKFSRK
jgi:TonB family protein